MALVDRVQAVAGTLSINVPEPFNPKLHLKVSPECEYGFGVRLSLFLVLKQRLTIDENAKASLAM